MYYLWAGQTSLLQVSWEFKRTTEKHSKKPRFYFLADLAQFQDVLLFIYLFIYYAVATYEKGTELPKIIRKSATNVRGRRTPTVLFLVLLGWHARHPWQQPQSQYGGLLVTFWIVCGLLFGFFKTPINQWTRKFQDFRNLRRTISKFPEFEVFSRRRNIETVLKNGANRPQWRGDELLLFLP